MNKVICTRLYWDPDRPAIETVRDYAAFEFSPEVADEVTTVVNIFEENHQRNQIGRSAIAANELIKSSDAKLTPHARNSWRWRLFCIRAAIDEEMYRNSQGQGRAKVFREVYEELLKISFAANAWSVLRPELIPAVDIEGPGLSAAYAEAVAASKPTAWWRMGDFQDRTVKDATGNKNSAVCEEGVALGPPNPLATTNRAACLIGGRLRAAIEKLPDSYSVEFWFCNNLPHTARPVTAYLFSRGQNGPEGTPGDNLGISGTSAVNVIPPGRLFFYNGNPAKQLFGKTELTPETWNHVVLVRDGKRIVVYLNGNAAPEISGELDKGYPDGVVQSFVGGRNDSFANLQGKVAEVAVYGRALAPEEAVRHYKAAARGK